MDTTTNAASVSTMRSPYQAKRNKASDSLFSKEKASFKTVRRSMNQILNLYNKGDHDQTQMDDSYFASSDAEESKKLTSRRFNNKAPTFRAAQR